MFQSPSLRVALGLGDQELEQRLRPALDAADELAIVAQCLAADQLLQLVQAQQIDALVVAWSLHRLTDAVLDQLDRPGLILVLLVPDPHDPRWSRRSGPVLAIDADAPMIRQAVLAARPGLRVSNRPRPPAEPVRLKPADSADRPVGGVIAVAGGAGSPGRTTVAINLAAALSAAGPTVLVEADLCAPAVAAYLDRDPSRNICTLAHTVRDDPRLWSTALAEELQPLSRAPISTDVLCGPPKREMRASVPPALMEQLVGELARRYRWVILDVGAELLGAEAAAACHRVALARAQHVLLVVAADLVGIWHARTALDQFERLLGIERRRVNLVLNRHDIRFHHSPREVEFHLAAPIAAVVPFDQVAMQRATSGQRPAVVEASSRASRALIALAEALNDGRVRVPFGAPDPKRNAPAWLRSMLGRRPSRTPNRRALEPDRTHIPALVGRRSRAW